MAVAKLFPIILDLFQGDFVVLGVGFFKMHKHLVHPPELLFSQLLADHLVHLGLSRLLVLSSSVVGEGQERGGQSGRSRGLGSRLESDGGGGGK